MYENDLEKFSGQRLTLEAQVRGFRELISVKLIGSLCLA